MIFCEECVEEGSILQYNPIKENKKRLNADVDL